MSKITTYVADQQRQFTVSKETNDFSSLIHQLSVKEKDHRNFICLIKAIHKSNCDFYGTLLPLIAQWASDHTQAKLFEPLEHGKTSTITYTAKQARYLLANAFFLNTEPGYGNIDMSHLYNSLFTTVAVERIRCLIEYFRLSSENIDDERQISIERYSCGDELPDWSQQTIPIVSSKINIFTDRMENAKEAQGFVDFANKHIHIHRIIPSATQEEVLFSCCPEAFISILACETLNDDEIVIIRGCKRFIDYTGYLDSFAYAQPFDNEVNGNQIQDILVMDACYAGHFTKENIDRDLGKAWAAFSKSKNEIIVTGNWGCGAFGGDPTLKFLQQVCAVMLLGDYFKRLDYSAYHDEKLSTRTKKLLKEMETKKKTVADVYEMMIGYSRLSSFPGSRPLFSVYVESWLNDS